jgi:hypothetical protein
MKLTPDPHGQAALILCESLLFLLIEQSVIGKDRAAEAIGDAIDVKQELAGTNESVVVSMESIGLLRAVARSLLAS